MLIFFNQHFAHVYQKNLIIQNILLIRYLHYFMCGQKIDINFQIVLILIFPARTYLPLARNIVLIVLKNSFMSLVSDQLSM